MKSDISRHDPIILKREPGWIQDSGQTKRFLSTLHLNMSSLFQSRGDIHYRQSIPGTNCRIPRLKEKNSWSNWGHLSGKAIWNPTKLRLRWLQRTKTKGESTVYNTLFMALCVQPISLGFINSENVKQIEVQGSEKLWIIAY